MPTQNGLTTTHPPYDYGQRSGEEIPISFPFLSADNYVRPIKDDPKYGGKSGELYHLDYAKWALYNSHDHKHHDWMRRIKRNKRFYKGHQWEKGEDIENFLKDDSGHSRNRIMVTINQIRPMVEQFRGNAIRLALGASAKSVSKHVKNRRERALEEALFTTEIAGEFEYLGEIIRMYDSLIGETPLDTERVFNNTYVDKYTQDINKLLVYSAELNELTDQQIIVAENLVFSGLGSIHEFEHGGHLRKEAFPAEEFIFDRNARRPDLQDAAYQGRARLVNLPLVLEKWQGLNSDERKALEHYTSNAGLSANSWTTDASRNNVGNSVPVYEIYWRDSETKKYGWVKDDFDQPYHVELNVPDTFAEGKVYTEADLIEPPNTPEN